MIFRHWFCLDVLVTSSSFSFWIPHDLFRFMILFLGWNFSDPSYCLMFSNFGFCIHVGSYKEYSQADCLTYVCTIGLVTRPIRWYCVPLRVSILILFCYNMFTFIVLIVGLCMWFKIGVWLSNPQRVEWMQIVGRVAPIPRDQEPLCGPRYWFVHQSQENSTRGS